LSGNACYTKDDDISPQGRGNEYCEGIFQASTPTSFTPNVSPHVCVGMTGRIFRRCVLQSCASQSSLPPFRTPWLREHVTLLTAQDAEGSVRRLAGKTERVRPSERFIGTRRPIAFSCVLRLRKTSHAIHLAALLPGSTTSSLRSSLKVS